MATTAQQLLSDIERLNSEAKPIRDRITEDMKELEQLHAQRSRIPEGIARGTQKESVIAENRRRVEIVEARLAGNRQLLAPIEARIREIQQRRQDHEAEENKRARLAKFEDLKRNGEALSVAIVEKVLHLVTNDIARFDEVRYQLASEFADLGGYNESMRLFSLLFDHKVHKNNFEYLHEAELKRRGWKNFWRFISGRQSAPGMPHGPGTPLPAVEIPIRSMLPPER